MAKDIEKAHDEQEELSYESLAEYVKDCFTNAKNHRDEIGMTETIRDCLMRYRGKYSAEDMGKFKNVSVYRGLTGMICRSAYSWLKDSYFNAQDKPWTLEPTPLPELPRAIQEMLAEALAKQVQMDFENPVTDRRGRENRQKILDNLRNTASRLAMKHASEAVQGMSKLIEDQLIEAQFRRVLNEFLLDIIIYPMAILKGPIVRSTRRAIWDEDEYKFEEVETLEIERVDPMDLFLSPDSTNSQDGEYVIERMKISRSRLIEAQQYEGFSKDAIKLVIAERDLNRVRKNTSPYVENDNDKDLTGVDDDTNGLRNNDNLFEVLEYNGRISGFHLLEFLIEDDMLDMTIEEVLENFDETVETEWGNIDPFEDYESTIWLCNDVIIMARIAEPEPVPYRPYFITSCFKIPGSPYGESIPMVIADLQDEVNMAARSRYYNMGMASGPIVEADVSRMPDNDYPHQIEPWSVYPVQTNSAQGNNSANAFKFHNIESRANELTAVMEEAWEKAHRVSGIPPYMYGDGTGSAETLGAFSLQYAGATKGIKSIIGNIDSDVIEKLVEQFYYQNMYYHEDNSVKADAKVNVRGASGLIAQEQRQARPLELLNALGPVLAQQRPEIAMALAMETLNESGYDLETLNARLQGGQASVELQNRTGQAPTGQPVPAGPPVDGRSGAVPQQLNQQQLPAGPVGPTG